MPTYDTKTIRHPTRVGIMEILHRGPTRRSRLIEDTGASLAEIAYHCRALRAFGHIRHAPASGPESPDPLFEAA